MTQTLPAILPLLYEYPYDFSDYSTVLSSQVVGTEPTAELAEVMAKVTKHPWTTTPKQAYTLYKATVTYLGANATEYPTCMRYKQVLIITLSARYKSRKLYLVYNTRQTA